MRIGNGPLAWFVVFVFFTLLGWGIDRMAFLVSVDIDYDAFGFPWRFLLISSSGNHYQFIWGALVADLIVSWVFAIIGVWVIKRMRSRGNTGGSNDVFV